MFPVTQYLKAIVLYHMFYFVFQLFKVGGCIESSIMPGS